MRPKWLADLPKNVSVTITKPEEGPVKIVVQKDGKTWEATEDKLDGLPEDIRSVVQGMFSGGMSIVVGGGRTPEFRWRELREAPRGKEKPRSEPAPEAQGEAKRPQQPAAPPADALQQRLDQIHRQMREQQENLQRELEKLRREMEKMRQEKPKPEKI
jgi:hypothetical protein